jgi:streptomycin 6-kinase
VEAERGEHVDAGVHARHDREVAAGAGIGQEGTRRGVALVAVEESSDLRHDSTGSATIAPIANRRSREPVAMTEPADAIAAAVERWDLRIGTPFEPGATAWVVGATTPTGDEVVLKVLRRHPEAEGEAIGLRAWGGDGAIRLLDSFTRTDELVLLLERCVPGTPLRERPEPDQDKVIARLLPRLWRAPVPDGVPTLVDMCDAWADAFAPDPLSIDAGVAREGIALFRSLPRDAPATVLLATDLHAGNVLAATREPWLVIDPKPHAGDPTYDVLQHLLNCTDRLVDDPVRLVQRMADLAGIDETRLEQWLLARCVIGTTTWPSLAGVATRLAMRRPGPSPRRINDPATVRADDETRFLARRLSSWAALDGELVEDAAIDALRTLAPARLLEVGCGTGDFTERVQREVAPASLVAVDLSPRMVELTRARRIDARVADIAALPFDDASFDVVLANRVLYHLPDIDSGVAELARVLRPGGALVVITYAPGHLQELYDTIRPRPDDGVDDGLDAIAECFAKLDQRVITGVARFPSVDAVAGSLAAWGDFSWFADVDVHAALMGRPMPFAATYRHVLAVATL